MRTERCPGIPALLHWATELLERHGVEKPRLNAELLLCHCTGRSRVELYAYPERGLGQREMKGFLRAVMRRARREPLQYIIGRKGFRRLEIVVDPRVLIPRPETEILVERALEVIKGMAGHPVVVDVGTGSGCIALSIAQEYPPAVVHATEISEDALRVAEENAARLGLDGAVVFHRGDLLEALPGELRGGVHLVVSNPPYVREEDLPSLPPEVRDHEPRLALVAGRRGTECHSRLMRQAREWLVPGGTLLMEAGEDQLEELASWARKLGYRDVHVHCDLNRRPRMVEMRNEG